MSQDDNTTHDPRDSQSVISYLVHIATPEFTLAFIVLCIFAAAYFVDPTPTKEGTLISAFSTAMAYFLGQDRKKDKGVKEDKDGTV